MNFEPPEFATEEFLDELLSYGMLEERIIELKTILKSIEIYPIPFDIFMEAVHKNNEEKWLSENLKFLQMLTTMKTELEEEGRTAEELADLNKIIEDLKSTPRH